MANMAKNMNKSSRGHRYDSFSEKFYEVIRIWGGKRLVNFVAKNLCGPSESTERRTRQKRTRKYKQEGLNDDFQVPCEDL